MNQSAAVCPEVDRAKAYGARLESDSTQSVMGPLLEGLDWLAQGIAIFDSHGELIYANSMAMRTLRASPSLGSAQRTGVAAACLRDERFLVQFESEGRLRFATIAPLRTEGRRLALVVYGRVDLCGPIELQMFASRHGITYTEAQVLRHLSEGKTSPEIARAQGVAVSTVLTQVASLRAKTASSTVKQMLNRVACIPSLRERGHPSAA